MNHRRILFGPPTRLARPLFSESALSFEGAARRQPPPVALERPNLIWPHYTDMNIARLRNIP
jgi:hypothetical protein